MAYRRRQGITRASTFKEEIYHHRPNPTPTPTDDDDDVVSSHTSSSLAARAIRASAAHRDSSIYAPAAGDSLSSASSLHHDSDIFSRSKGPALFQSASMKNPDESKHGFWGILARKAKAILEDENDPQRSTVPNRRMRPQATDASTTGQFHQPRSSEGGGKMDNARRVRNGNGLDAMTSSLDHIGNALEEGHSILENRTADIIQETREPQSRRRGVGSEMQNQSFNLQISLQQPETQPLHLPAQTNQETQLKASRDVAMATAAKAKLLLRELKTTKADLAFAKERCAQLEEENKRLRESREKGSNANADDDDLIRLQLETLLAEKARLAHENSIYARENRFLREIVEYHQLTMQDLVDLDEGSEEAAEVHRFSIDGAKVISSSSTSPTSPISTS
ncbi:hypothetical protein Dimus_034834 [Dionaea muscipula]